MTFHYAFSFFFFLFFSFLSIYLYSKDIVSFSSKVLFTGSTDQTVKSWNIARGEPLKTFEGHGGSVICLIVSKNIYLRSPCRNYSRFWPNNMKQNFPENWQNYQGNCKFLLSQNEKMLWKLIKIWILWKFLQTVI